MLPLYFFREFSDGSHAGFFFFFFFFFLKIWGVSLTRPALVHFYRESLSYTSRAGFFFFFPRAFLLHIPCWLYFYVGSFSNTSHAVFFFFFFFFLMWGVSLTHPMLALFLSGEFHLNILC